MRSHIAGCVTVMRFSAEKVLYPPDNPYDILYSVEDKRDK